MSDFNRILQLDAAKGGPFRFQHDGQRYTVVSPKDMPFAEVLMAIAKEAIPGTPRMPFWKREVLFRAWAAHHDLPNLADAQRLLYVIDRYQSMLEYDLQAQLRVDLGALWRARQWRRLLGFIDRLPPHCYYSEAVSNDPEHAEMIAKSIEARSQAGETSDPAGPPLHTWTPEMGMLAKIVDGIHHLDYVLRAVNSSKDSPTPKMAPPEPRPTSALEKARKRAAFQRKQQRHESLVARMLPHKADKAD